MPRYSIIDDTHPDLVYSGVWRQETTLNARSPEYNGTVHATNDPNATITYNFYGTILDAFGSINQPGIRGYPNASFTIQPNAVPIKHFNESGTVPSILDESLNLATSHIRMFRSGKFAEGNYTMTIKADGVSAGGPTYYFDFLSVQCPDGVYVEDVLLDDKTTQWDYEGGWNEVTGVGNNYESLHNTPLQGGSASLGFHGTEIAVYGALQGPYNDSLPIAYFSVSNSAETHPVFAANVSKSLIQRNSTYLQNQLIFHTTGLPDIGQKQYTLTVSIPTPPATSTSISTSISGSQSATTSSTSSSSTITPTPLASQWQLDYVIYGPSYALSPSPTATASSSSSAPPAGAIAGGVIGGLAGIVLLVLAFLFWRRRHRAAIAHDAEVQDEFKNAYGATSAATSRPTLAARRSSIHKGSRGMASGNHLDVPVLDISASSPMASTAGRVETSTMTGGTSTADTAYETDYAAGVMPPRPVREMDGGVRLASGSEYDSEVVEVLPPSYARY